MLLTALLDSFLETDVYLLSGSVFTLVSSACCHPDQAESHLLLVTTVLPALICFILTFLKPCFYRMVLCPPT